VARGLLTATSIALSVWPSAVSHVDRPDSTVQRPVVGSTNGYTVTTPNVSLAGPRYDRPLG